MPLAFSCGDFVEVAEQRVKKLPKTWETLDTAFWCGAKATLCWGFLWMIMFPFVFFASKSKKPNPKMRPIILWEVHIFFKNPLQRDPPIQQIRHCTIFAPKGMLLEGWFPTVGFLKSQKGAPLGRSEVFNGCSGDADPYKIDVWSLGVILFALCHGRRGVWGGESQAFAWGFWLFFFLAKPENTGAWAFFGRSKDLNTQALPRLTQPP